MVQKQIRNETALITLTYRHDPSHRNTNQGAYPHRLLHLPMTFVHYIEGLHHNRKSQGCLPMVQENKVPKVSSLNFGQCPVVLGRKARHSFLHAPQQTFSAAQPLLLLQSSQLHYSIFHLLRSPAERHQQDIMRKPFHTTLPNRQLVGLRRSVKPMNLDIKGKQLHIQGGKERKSLLI